MAPIYLTVVPGPGLRPRPGTQEHGPTTISAKLVFMVSGPAPSGDPGMTIVRGPLWVWRGERAMDEVAVRLGVQELIAAYVDCIDDDRLQDWPDFFAEQCRVVIN